MQLGQLSGLLCVRTDPSGLRQYSGSVGCARDGMPGLLCPTFLQHEVVLRKSGSSPFRNCVVKLFRSSVFRRFAGLNSTRRTVLTTHTQSATTRRNFTEVSVCRLASFDVRAFTTFLRNVRATSSSTDSLRYHNGI
ncbi:hypothetical protein AVEN_20450-1 [Araneus ventricosus]|uniref:Uncharacterized protein n=1 Tax=Araneus ventricosus TaxID=182803 RepID=A0A4Y2QUF4_ARAVE|nr:hypothetical protein AVEN_20450-1 [Araneus ventricosus]